MSPQAKSHLINEGYDPHYGARPLKRVIQNKILNPLAEMLVGGKIGESTTISIGFSGGKLTFDSKLKAESKKHKKTATAKA
jgi:ATP-dependent Clp protease ATP-binding subunit ClpB